MIYFLAISSVLFFSVSVFLAKELVKKFRFFQCFVSSSRQLVPWYYKRKNVEKKGMHNIVLRGEKQFSALVGFELELPVIGNAGFDYYGLVHSDKEGKAVFSTYLGNGDCKFVFFLNEDIKVSVSSSEEDQKLNPTEIYPPHWWQKFGYFS